MASVKRSFDYGQIVGKPVTAALRNPGVAEDGSVPVWNNGLKKWEPGAGGGGGGTATALRYEDWDASGDDYPPTYNGGAIAQFNHYRVTVASPPDGNGDVKFPLGAILISQVAAPGQIDANWKILQA